MTSKHRTDSDSQVAEKEKIKVDQPRLFRVILLNDDYTTMEFVVMILETVFKKSPSEAVQIMLRVHRQGQGICGSFPKQIAEAKVMIVHERAREAGFPLRCIMEPE